MENDQFPQINDRLNSTKIELINDNEVGQDLNSDSIRLDNLNKTGQSSIQEFTTNTKLTYQQQTIDNPSELEFSDLNDVVMDDSSEKDLIINDKLTNTEDDESSSNSENKDQQLNDDESKDKTRGHMSESSNVIQYEDSLNEHQSEDCKSRDEFKESESKDNELKENQLSENELKESELKEKESFNQDKNSQDKNKQEDNEGIGFPKCFDGWVIRGKTVPINKKTLNEIEIDGNDSILDCVSQVVPILLKKPSIFPPKFENMNKNKDSKTKDQNESFDKVDEQQADEQKKDESSKFTKLKEQSKESLREDSSFLMISNFYKSSVGSFLMNIGLSKCKEALYKDGMRQYQRLIRKEGERSEYLEELNKQTQLYNEYKGANSIFDFDQIKCSLCDFRTESEVVMNGHFNTPHLSTKKEYKCNFCAFITRDQRTIDYHFKFEHKKYCKIELPQYLHECPTCNYESNQKSKATTHMAKCIKLFDENKVQLTIDNETEYPAITPKPIDQDLLKLYESNLQALRPLMIMNPAMQKPQLTGLPKALLPQILAILQQQFNQQKIKLNKAIANKLSNQQNNLRQIQTSSFMSNLLMNSANTLTSLNNSNLINNLTNNLTNLNNISNLNNLSNLNFAKTAPQLYNMLQGGSQLLNNPKNRPSLPSSNQINNIQQLKPNIKGILPDNKSVSNCTAGSFVICEICDGYIKDLEQLRTHMSWVHKVKIHPKMLASRPPLNCQKCQWRFFTDQGLERHLLGQHGLVTSNMQDLVDQGQDGGRCIVCGKVFTCKLVAHMNQTHKLVLRPAHLSYKCTVCSATFNLYRLFENHVYMVHSPSAKRANDNETNSISKKAKTVDLKINGI